MTDTTNFTNIRALLSALAEAMNLINADVIENCQCPWQIAHECAASMSAEQRELLRCSGVIYLADQVSIQLDPRLPVLTQAQALRKQVEQGRAHSFAPTFRTRFCGSAGRNLSGWTLRTIPSF